jgi:glutamyl-tRNA reductase
VDLVICCTAATDAVLTLEHIAGAGSTRRRPLVVCDLGLPRNVEPAVGDVPGATLLDLTTVARRLEQRGTGSGAVASAQHLITREVRSYLLAQRTAEVIPTVAVLRKRAAEVVDVELGRLDGRLPGLDSAVRTELTRTVRRVVDKLLHAPTVRIKQLAESGGGQGLRRRTTRAVRTRSAGRCRHHHAAPWRVQGFPVRTGQGNRVMSAIRASRSPR